MVGALELRAGDPHDRAYDVVARAREAVRGGMRAICGDRVEHLVTEREGEGDGQPLREGTEYGVQLEGLASGNACRRIEAEVDHAQGQAIANPRCEACRHRGQRSVECCGTACAW